VLDVIPTVNTKIIAIDNSYRIYIHREGNEKSVKMCLYKTNKIQKTKTGS